MPSSLRAPSLPPDTWKSCVVNLLPQTACRVLLLKPKPWILFLSWLTLSRGTGCGQKADWCSGHGWAGQGRPADGLGAELGMRTGLGRFGTGGRLGQLALTPVSIPQSAAGVRKLSRDGALGPCHRPASRGIGSSRWNKIYGVGTGRGAMGSGRPAGNISASGLRGLSGLGKEGQECRRLCPSSVGLPGSGRAGLRCQLHLTPSSPSQPWRGEGASRKPQD